MKRSFTALAVTLFLAPACYADSVFNCSTASGTSFQSMPCMVVAVNDVALLPLARPETRSMGHEGVAPASLLPGPIPHKAAAVSRPFAEPAAAFANPPTRRDVVHSRSDELQAGMSDLQVLNNRRWGKPQHISRNREERGWHEYWDYKTGANGGKQLHFVNGMLADIEDLVPARTTVSMVSTGLAEQRY